MSEEGTVAMRYKRHTEIRPTHESNQPIAGVVGHPRRSKVAEGSR